MTKTERLMLSVSAALLALDASACTPKHDARGVSPMPTPTPTPVGYASGNSGHGHGHGYGYGYYGTGGTYGRGTSGAAGSYVDSRPVVVRSSSGHEGFFHRLFGSFGRTFRSFG